MSNVDGLVKSLIEDNKNNKITDIEFRSSIPAGIFNCDGVVEIRFIGTPNQVLLRKAGESPMRIKTNVRVYENVLDKELIVYFFDRKLEAVSNIIKKDGSTMILTNCRFETF